MAKEIICLGSDHAGFQLKEEIRFFLVRGGFEIIDLGPSEYDANDDYPDYAVKVCQKVLETKGMGILICGSGQGMSITANKIRGIYAALCWDGDSATLAREHLNANVLCLGARFIMVELAKQIVGSWLETMPAGLEK